MADLDPIPTGFTRRAPSTAGDMDFELIRVKAKGRVSGICLSSDLLCREIHFWRGRSQPHLERECEPCMCGDRSLWKGWIYIFNPNTRTIKILEITKRAMVPLEVYFTEHRTLRGSIVTVMRAGELANGKLFAQVSPGTIDRQFLPKVPDLATLLERMWHGKRSRLRVLDSGIVLPEPRPGEAAG